MGRWLAAPAEWAFRQGVALRTRWWDAHGGTRIEGLRVASVGNLAVGGTGKTPFTAWGARVLSDHGVPCALLLGAGAGDEALLHERWNPRVPIFSHRERAAAAYLAREAGYPVALLDDGFQHRRLARDLDLVLLAAEDPFPGPLLPRGPYREPPGALERAHGVVVTRRVAGDTAAAELAGWVASLHPHLVVARLRLGAGGWQGLGGEPAAPPEGPVLVVSSVARPHDFAHHVEKATGARVQLLAYRDHHFFTARDARTMRQRAGERTVVVTEKDAVKLRTLHSEVGSTRVLCQTLEWEGGEAAITKMLLALTDRRQ